MSCGRYLSSSWEVTEIAYSKNREELNSTVYGNAFARFFYGVPVSFLLLLLIIILPTLLAV